MILQKIISSAGFFFIKNKRILFNKINIIKYFFFIYSIGKGKHTIIPKIEGKTIGQRKMMSKTDCLKINELYGCLGTPPNYNQKYYTLCNYMGL